tara:strand:- start:27235 stop:27570 length:336 start_codon:yes stop_codon:yes gene_type:complete
MANEHDPGIKTGHDLTESFNEAANPPTRAKEPLPTVELRPPAPMGPGLGSISQNHASERAVSPQLRDPDSAAPPKSPPTREAFNTAARAGALRAMFERRAGERTNERDHDR